MWWKPIGWGKYDRNCLYRKDQSSCFCLGNRLSGSSGRNWEMRDELQVQGSVHHSCCSIRSSWFGRSTKLITESLPFNTITQTITQRVFHLNHNVYHTRIHDSKEKLHQNIAGELSLCHFSMFISIIIFYLTSSYEAIKLLSKEKNFKKFLRACIFQ